jgi:hypothetical protein
VATTAENGYVSVLLGNGDGTFQSPKTYETGDSGAVAIGDLNGDGKPDLVVANGVCQLQYTLPNPTIVCIGATISVLLGNGDGTFQSRNAYGTGNVPMSIAIGDFNADGKLDLATANSADGTASVLLGKGDGTFQTKMDFPAGFTPQAIAMGDFNLDGRPDLVVASNFLDSTMSLLIGNGDGTFQSPAAYATGPNPCSIAVGDLNLDGKPDVGVANCVGTVSVLRNIQGPDFFVTPSAPATVSAGASAKFNLAVVPVGGWSGTVNLSCAVTPAVTPAPVCTVSASVNVPVGTAAPVVVEVSTTAPGTAGSISRANPPSGIMPITWTIILLASGLLCAGYRRRKPALATLTVVMAFLTMLGCGGGGSSSPTPPSGTPGGTYTATVTAKSGSLSHSSVFTVIVQ